MRPYSLGAGFAMTVAFWIGSATVVRGGEGCGCGQPEPTCCHARTHCCHRHARHGCCRDCGGGGSRDVTPVGRATAPPRGAIVESMAMPRMMPMMAMPMMYADMGMMAPVRRAAFDDQPSRELNCQGSSARVDDLEKRVNALRDRVNTLQETMEVQTEILQSIKRKLDKMDQD